MRKLACLCLTAALCVLALPALADAPPAADASVTLDVLFAEEGEVAPEASPAVLEGTPEPLFTAGEPCGGVICSKGTYCCNPTCNMCVLPGMSCTQQVCN